MDNKGNGTVYIIDDDESVRKALSLFLTASGYQVKAMSSSEEYLENNDHSGAGCLILDVFLEGVSGLELQNKLQQMHSHLPIIFITGQGNIPMSVNTLKNGAFDFLEKPFDHEKLIEAVTGALALSHKLQSKNDDILRCQHLIDVLTPREHQILAFVITGMLNKQIAGKLNIAEHTVKLHRHNICDKLGVKSVPEIILIAEKSGRFQIADF
jgi:FixJ family two-component response regulator